MLLEAARLVTPSVTKASLKRACGPGPYTLDELAAGFAARADPVRVASERRKTRRALLTGCLSSRG